MAKPQFATAATFAGLAAASALGCAILPGLIDLARGFGQTAPATLRRALADPAPGPASANLDAPIFDRLRFARQAPFAAVAGATPEADPGEIHLNAMVGEPVALPSAAVTDRDRDAGPAWPRTVGVDIDGDGSAARPSPHAPEPAAGPAATSNTEVSSGGLTTGPPHPLFSPPDVARQDLPQQAATATDPASHPQATGDHVPPATVVPPAPEATVVPAAIAAAEPSAVPAAAASATAPPVKPSSAASQGAAPQSGPSAKPSAAAATPPIVAATAPAAHDDDESEAKSTARKPAPSKSGRKSSGSGKSAATSSEPTNAKFKLWPAEQILGFPD